MIEVQVNIDCADADALRGVLLRGARIPARTATPGSTGRACPAAARRARRSCSNRCPSRRPSKNRVHLDLVVDDIEAESTRWVALGATRVSAEPVCEHGGCWIVMLDPEGNEICLLR